jgi:DNA-binding Lrp family transcriptional regulator
MRAVFLLVKVEPGKLREVADAFGDLEVCSEIYSTAGDFDLLAKIYVESFDELADLVTDKIQKVPHIRETKSILTFRTYKEPARGR